MAIKALFIITISTARMLLPNLPILPGLQPGEMPAETNTISKSVSMALTSPKRTDQIPSVRVDVPEGLGVGPSVKLIVEQPEKPVDASKTAAAATKATAKTYWGSSEVVSWGQPKIEDIPATSSTDAAQTGSVAYWPIGYSKEKVAGPSSKIAGKYTLTSNFSGGTSVTLGDDQKYLEPVNVIGLKDTVDLAKPIKIKWTKVPRAVGYLVTAFGGNDNESITWTSGSDAQAALALENNPVTKENLDGYLKKRILLPPDLPMCTIPPGIFKNATDVVVTVTAIGADMLQAGQDMDTYVLVRSIASIPLTLAVTAPPTSPTPPAP